MAATERTLAVLGATGYTGRLVCEEARAAGLRLRLVGRRSGALDDLAAPGEETAVADARDEDGLRRAFEGAFAVVSCAGPFLELGDAPVRAAIAARAHYLDSSGEQAFARLVYARHEEAAGAGVVLLTCFGFDYVPGDLAARLAAEGLDEPLDEVAVAYSLTGIAASRGTRRTIGRVVAQPQVAWQDGSLVESGFGATTRAVRFPFGEREVVEWSGTEPLTVPRHTAARTVRSYVRIGGASARLARAARLAAPVLRASARLRGDPSPEQRARTRFVVVAEARSANDAGRRATLAGHDPYALTVRLLVRGVEALAAGESRGVGALAPAEAFDAHALVSRLAPFLSVESVGPL